MAFIDNLSKEKSALVPPKSITCALGKKFKDSLTDVVKETVLVFGVFHLWETVQVIWIETPRLAGIEKVAHCKYDGENTAESLGFLNVVHGLEEREGARKRDKLTMKSLSTHNRSLTCLRSVRGSIISASIVS